MATPVNIGHHPAWLSQALGTPVETWAPQGRDRPDRHLLPAPDGRDRTVLAKLPAADPAARDMMAGAYRGEVRFYQQLAATVAARVPACHHAEMSPDSGDFVLLLEDLASHRPATSWPAAPSTRREAVVNLAGLHGPAGATRPCSRSRGSRSTGPRTRRCWPSSRTGDRAVPGGAGRAGLARGRRHPARVRRGLRAVGPGPCRPVRARARDHRLDNLMFPADGSAGVVAVDFQTLSLALPARDLAFFLGTSLLPADRRSHERDLVAAYHARAHAVRRGGLLGGPDLRRLRLRDAAGSAGGRLRLRVRRADRARDRMFAAMVTRSCTAIRDLGTLGLVGSRRLSAAPDGGSVGGTTGYVVTGRVTLPALAGHQPANRSQAAWRVTPARGRSRPGDVAGRSIRTPRS